MHIFALNCGSSSLKSAVIDSDRRSRLLDVRVENLDTSNLELRPSTKCYSGCATGDQHGHRMPSLIASCTAASASCARR